MQAQTHVDVLRGLEAIKSAVMTVLHGTDEQKASMANDFGVFDLLDSIEETTRTIREVVNHDNGAIHIRPRIRLNGGS